MIVTSCYNHATSDNKKYRPYALSVMKRMGTCCIPANNPKPWMKFAKDNNLIPTLGMQCSRPTTENWYEWMEYHKNLFLPEFKAVVVEHPENWDKMARRKQRFLQTMYDCPVCLFNCGHYIRITDKKWIEPPYWNIRESNVYSPAIYRPQDKEYTTHAFSMAIVRGKIQTVWLSLGVGYGDDGKTWGEVTYPVAYDRAIARLCVEHEMEIVIIHPAPGDKRFPNSNLHINAFLDELYPDIRSRT